MDFVLLVALLLLSQHPSALLVHLVLLQQLTVLSLVLHVRKALSNQKMDSQPVYSVLLVPISIRLDKYHVVSVLQDKLPMCQD